jgi:Resolvase, N terminal domain
MVSQKDTREPKDCIAYIRVSTKQQGKSGLGLEAQQEAIAQFCKRERFEVPAATAGPPAVADMSIHVGDVEPFFISSAHISCMFSMPSRPV